MISLWAFIFLSGCTPTCEQTCKNFSVAKRLSPRRWSVKMLVLPKNNSLMIGQIWEEAENEAKLNEQQEREEADANGSTYSPSKTTSQATQQTEDEEASSKYQQAFDEYKICISDKTCGKLLMEIATMRIYTPIKIIGLYMNKSI